MGQVPNAPIPNSGQHGHHVHQSPLVAGAVGGLCPRCWDQVLAIDQRLASAGRGQHEHRSVQAVAGEDLGEAVVMQQVAAQLSTRGHKEPLFRQYRADPSGTHRHQGIKLLQGVQAAQRISNTDGTRHGSD